MLLFIADSTRFRRPESFPAARPLVLAGGIGYALLNLIHEVVLAIEAHKFATGHDFTNKAVEKALLSSGSIGIMLGLLGLFAALALTVGHDRRLGGAMRAGLLPRWLSVLGVLSGLLFLPFFATATLQLIPTFWLVATGILLMGRCPTAIPPPGRPASRVRGRRRPNCAPSARPRRVARLAAPFEQPATGAGTGASRPPAARAASAANAADSGLPPRAGSRRKRRKRG